MKYQYVFLLGRPAAGKSAFYRAFKEQLLASGKVASLERRDDVHKVWAKLWQDDVLEAEGKARLWSRCKGPGDYELTDYRMLDEILEELSADVLDIKEPDHLVVLEFARPSYVDALQSFDSAILNQCLVVYLQASFETCLARNAARRPVTGETIGDDHWVPDKTMHSVYRHADRDRLLQHLLDRNIPFVVVDNEAEGEEHLVRQVQDLVQAHFPRVDLAPGEGEG